MTYRFPLALMSAAWLGYASLTHAFPAILLVLLAGVSAVAVTLVASALSVLTADDLEKHLEAALEDENWTEKTSGIFMDDSAHIPALIYAIAFGCLFFGMGAYYNDTFLNVIGTMFLVSFGLLAHCVKKFRTAYKQILRKSS
jgi:hypothetical protein